MVLIKVLVKRSQLLIFILALTAGSNNNYFVNTGSNNNNFACVIETGLINGSNRITIHQFDIRPRFEKFFKILRTKLFSSDLDCEQ